MSDWIEWNGGGCPVPPETQVEVRLRNGHKPDIGKAGMRKWGRVNGSHGSEIVAYRVREKAEAPRETALARQEGGGHYKDLKIQPIEYIHANGIPFAEGSVIKYVTRWRAKGGIKDLEKARHFLDLLIELESRNG